MSRALILAISGSRRVGHRCRRGWRIGRGRNGGYRICGRWSFRHGSLRHGSLRHGSFGRRNRDRVCGGRRWNARSPGGQTSLAFLTLDGRLTTGLPLLLASTSLLGGIGFSGGSGCRRGTSGAA